MARFKSDYAMLDITKGRTVLSRAVGGTSDGNGTRIPVKITGYIDGVFGQDDGTSQEFNVIVTKLEVDYE